MNPQEDPLRYELAEGVATITFNRPDKLNAMTRDMAAQLIALFDRADADDAVRAVILTGAGRAFCAGADLSGPGSSLGQPSTAQPAAADDPPRDWGGLITLRMFDCLKPVIAAINGPAVGVGITLTLAADVRLASNTVKIAFPFTRRAIVPESASAWFLPRIVGISQALEWMLSGRTFLAAEALAGGLVRSVHEPQDLLPAARALAREMAQGTAPVSVALTRQMLWRMLGADHPMQAHRVDSRMGAARVRAADVREGVSSFLEKREPHFTDQVSRDMPDGFPWWTPPRFG